MVKHKTIQQLQNIPPEHRKELHEKLKEEKIEFQSIQIVKYKGSIGVFCPYRMDIFMTKQECRNCKRWLGGSGKVYYCLTQK